MGFGILFFGLLMLVEVVVSTSSAYPLGIDLLPDLAGYLLMLTAMCRLSDYAASFEKCKKALYPLLFVGGVSFAVGFISVFSDAHGLLWMISHVTVYMTLILQPIALWFMFSGIIALSHSLELDSIASRARYAAVVGLAYYAAQLVFTLLSDLPLGLTEAQLGLVRLFLRILSLIFVFFAEFIAFQCYMYICYEGDERITSEDIVNPFERLFGKFGKGKGGR